MIINDFIKSFNKLFYHQIMFYKRHAPEIKFISGMISGGAAIGTSAYAAVRTNNILEDRRYQLADIQYRSMYYPQDVYSPAQMQYEINRVNHDAVVGIMKCVSLPVIFTGSWAGLSIAGFMQQRARWIQATTALAATTNFLLQYRGRVREAVGAEEEARLYFGLDKKKATVVDMKEDGTVEEYVVETEEVKGPLSGFSPYAFVYGPKFEDGTKNYEWDENMDYNIRKVRMVEEMFTMMLASRDRIIKDKKTGESRVIPGSVLLNEVLVELGHPVTEAGCYTGWIHGNGDDHIDLGLGLNTTKRYWDGEECLFLDPNVDGVISDKVEQSFRNI